MKTKLKQIYSKEYLILIAIGFLPLIWKVLEITFLAGFENALKILGQILGKMPKNQSLTFSEGY